MGKPQCIILEKYALRMINCLIADDDQSFMDVLVNYVNQTDFLNLSGHTTDPTKVVQLVYDLDIDVLILSVDMRRPSGLEIAKNLSGKCDIILIANSSDYAFEGFELGAIDYLLKPVFYPRFMKAVQKNVNKIKAVAHKSNLSDGLKGDFIYVKTGVRNNVVKVVLSTIDYMESVKNYVAIYHDGQKTLVYCSLKEIETCLPTKHFIRVHRSFIVTLSKIERVEGNDILLLGGEVSIPLSDSYKTIFWQMVNDKTIG